MTQVSIGKEPTGARTGGLDRVQAISAAPEGTSQFVNGYAPRRRGLVLALSAIAGFLITVAWSASLVDDTIGFNVASGVLGHDSVNTPIAGIGAGVLFAFVSGFAGSFTACNIAAFGAVAPLVGTSQSRRDRFVAAVRPLGWLAVGMIPVSAVYGAIVGIVGTTMPQFNTAKTPGIPPRLLQAMIAFGTIGLIMIILGLAALRYIPDPLARISRRVPNASLILMGALIGGFLIGRPYPLFSKMFHHAAQTHNPLYGAAAFTLQSLGNILVMAVLFLLLVYGTGGRLQRWLGSNPRRASAASAAALIIGGFFLVMYWDFRVLGRLGYIWFPKAPWS